MNKIKLINRMGFNLYQIEDNELREECEYIFNNTLSNYYIDDTIKDFELCTDINSDKQIDSYTKVKICRGFNKLNDSYDFICMKNKLSNTVMLIIRPTLQSKFNSSNFGENLKMIYQKNNGMFEMNRISKYNGDLLAEKYIYTRDSITNDLVLLSENKAYYGDDVKYEEADASSIGKLRAIYDNGEYTNLNLEPVYSELYITSKTSNLIKKLYVNDLDTGLSLINGTTIYDLTDSFKYISNFDNDNYKNKTLMENFKQNYASYERNNNKNSLIKMFR